MRFVWKRIHFDAFTRSVHTYTFSVSSKTHRFWTRPWKWIKTKTHPYRISVDGRKRIKIKTMAENIAGACFCSMCIESSLRHNDLLARRFSPDFPQISCPPINPRACTVLHQLWRMATMTFVWMRVPFFENHFNPLLSVNSSVYRTR